MMDHPRWEQLVDFAEGRLDEGDRRDIERHLELCESCRADVTWLLETLPRLSPDHFVAPPLSARRAVQAAFEQRFAPPRGAARAQRPLRSRWHVPPAVQAALVALAAILLVALFVRASLNESRVFIAAVESLEGNVQVFKGAGGGQPLAEDATLAAGDFITTGMNSQVTLAFASGAVEVTLFEGSNVGIEQLQLNEAVLETLNLTTDTAGEIEIRVAGPGEAKLWVPYGVVSSRLGRFRVRYLDVNHGVALEVLEGTAHVENEYGAMDLEAGESVILYQKVAPGSPAPLYEEEGEADAAEMADDAPTPTLLTTPGDAATPAAASPPGGDTERLFGFVEQRPATPQGAWQIGGRRFVSTAETRVREDDGPLTVGSCVEVEFVPPDQATEIRPRDADKCLDD